MLKYILTIILNITNEQPFEVIKTNEKNETEYPSVNEQQDQIAVLDLEDFFSNDEEKQKNFVNQLGNSLHTTGFVLIKNHQIPQDKIDKVNESASAFFSLPLEIKQQYSGVAMNRGYKGFAPERQDKIADLQEYWHVGPINDLSKLPSQIDIPEIQKNIWPSEIASFESNFSSLYEEIAGKGQPILEACSLYMGKEKTFLSDLTHHGDSVMRVIHYMPNETQANQTTWKAAHKDPNLLTLIVGISKEGLEIQTRDGQWVAVPYRPDTIVVSASNMLENLSNGLIRSAPHRVAIKESKTSRFSIPFFYHVQRNLSIAPQPESILKTDGTPHYPDQTAEEALKNHQWFIPTNRSQNS